MQKHPLVLRSIFAFPPPIKFGSHTQNSPPQVCGNLRCCSEHQTEAKNNDGSWDLADLRDLRLIALPRRCNAPLSTFKRHYAESLHSIPFPRPFHGIFMHLRHPVQGLAQPEHPLAWPCNGMPHTQIVNLHLHMHVLLPFICSRFHIHTDTHTHRVSIYILHRKSPTPALHAWLFHWVTRWGSANVCQWRKHREGKSKEESLGPMQHLLQGALPRGSFFSEFHPSILLW